MATSQAIEKNVCADLVALLTAASIANVITEHTDRPEAATFVIVRCINLRGNLAAGAIPSGMRQADIGVECFSHRDDDTAGAALNTLLASVRTAIYRTDIVAALNTASTYHTYYGLGTGDDLPDTEGRFRIRSLQFSLVLKPEKA